MIAKNLRTIILYNFDNNIFKENLKVIKFNKEYHKYKSIYMY